MKENLDIQCAKEKYNDDRQELKGMRWLLYPFLKDNQENEGRVRAII